MNPGERIRDFLDAWNPWKHTPHPPVALPPQRKPSLTDDEFQRYMKRFSTIPVSPSQVETLPPLHESTLSAKKIQTPRSPKVTTRGADSGETAPVGLGITTGWVDQGAPPYVVLDIEVRDEIWRIMNMIENFARDYFGFEMPANGELRVYSALEDIQPETASLIQRIASVGPAGVEGWHSLFFDQRKRRVLVCGILGNVVVEQVFKHLFFGGNEEVLEKLLKVQDKLHDDNGFVRNARFAQIVEESLNSDIHGKYDLPPSFEEHVEEITVRTVHHFEPFLKLSETTALGFKAKRKKLLTDLYAIIAQAGMLNVAMRLDKNTVYHFVPLIKDDVYSRHEMECYNQTEMTENNPRHRTWPATVSDAEKRRAMADEPLVQIALMSGCTAYRQGGWQNQVGQYLQKGGDKDGFRSRVLTHGWVYCRWGRPKYNMGGKGLTAKEAHGEQWVEPGFIEFEDFLRVSRGVREDIERRASSSSGRSSVRRGTTRGASKTPTRRGAVGKGKGRAR